MKILFLIPGVPDGVGMNFSKQQSILLKEKGIDVKVLFLTSRMNPVTIIKEWMFLLKDSMKFKPDIIHAHYGTMTAFLCAFGTRHPLVITFHGNDLNPHPWINPVRSAIGRLLSQLSALRADKIICVSKEVADRLWWRKTRIRIIPMGVDTSIFYPIERDKARELLGWAKDDDVILFHSGFDPSIKRPDLAKAVLEMVKAVHAKARLEDLKGHIPFEKMPLYINASDCLLLTSDTEGSPVMVKEAIACGLPVVSSDVGDVKERLRNVKPSFIVDKNTDTGKISEAICELLQNKKRSDFSAAIDEIDENILTDKIIDIYKEVMSGNAK